MINRIASGTPSFLSCSGSAGASPRKEHLFWHQYPAQQPTEIERWKTFLIAYPNPRFIAANLRMNALTTAFRLITTMSALGPALSLPIRAI